MKQRQENKLVTPFAPEPYEVISKHGNSVVIESPQGVQYKRNSTHVKKYFPREENLPPPADETDTVGQEEVHLPPQSAPPSPTSTRAGEEAKTPSEPEPVRRSQRNRVLPKQFEDYTMT